MAQPGQKQLVIPIQIRGKDADISISYKGITGQGELAGQMTKSMTIENVPDEFVLYANYPNPFNASTTLPYRVGAPGEIVIDIYNLSGQRVRRLMDSYHDVGHYTISWDGLDERAVPSSSGVYVVTMQDGGVLSTRKIILLK